MDFNISQYTELQCKSNVISFSRFMRSHIETPPTVQTHSPTKLFSAQGVELFFNESLQLLKHTNVALK